MNNGDVRPHTMKIRFHQQASQVPRLTAPKETKPKWCRHSNLAKQLKRTLLLPQRSSKMADSENARKRKTANPLDAAVASNDARTSAEGKARRVSTESIAAGTGAPEAPHNNLVNLEKLVRMDLFHADVDVVETALNYLNRTGQDNEKCDKVVSVGGCLALVLLLKNRLEKLFPKWEPIVCNSSLEEGETMRVERRLLYKTLSTIKTVAYKSKHSLNEFVAIGCIEAMIAIMEAIPLCGKTQGAVCGILCNLTAKESDAGVSRAIAARGM